MKVSHVLWQANCLTSWLLCGISNQR